MLAHMPAVASLSHALAGAAPVVLLAGASGLYLGHFRDRGIAGEL